MSFFVLLPVPRLPDDSLDSFCRRRARLARNVCKQAGFWSEIWAKRVVRWNEHVMRGGAYHHMCFDLITLTNNIIIK